jgi:hypothetical protein
MYPRLWLSVDEMLSQAASALFEENDPLPYI